MKTKLICKTCNASFEKYIYPNGHDKGLYCSRACVPSKVENLGTRMLGKKMNQTQLEAHRVRIKDWWSTRLKKDVSYKALHNWVSRNKGRPKHCVKCKTDDPNIIYDWANIDHKYGRNLDNYIRLCRNCHCLMDKHMKEWIKNT